MRFLLLVGILALGCGDDDGATDAGTDTATSDSGTDGGTDSGTDGGTDAGTDAATDGGDDAATDAAADTAADAAADTGGDAATDTGGDASLPRECTVDEDCQLINDCCACAAASDDATPPECPIDCLVPLCTSAGITTGAECLAGVCSLRNLNCDESTVVCDAPTPICPAGQLPHVTEGCYSGLCVPVEACRTVPSCATCPTGQACVSSQSFFESFSCVPVDPSCGGTPTCACMGDEACSTPFICSGESATEPRISCVCPTC